MMKMFSLVNICSSLTVGGHNLCMSSQIIYTQATATSTAGGRCLYAWKSTCTIHQGPLSAFPYPTALGGSLETPCFAEYTEFYI